MRRLVSASTITVAVATVSVDVYTNGRNCNRYCKRVDTNGCSPVATATVSVDVDTNRRVDTNGCYIPPCNGQ